MKWRKFNSSERGEGMRKGRNQCCEAKWAQGVPREGTRETEERGKKNKKPYG